jgi:coenzyme F420 hydrogenase subunit beta
MKLPVLNTVIDITERHLCCGCGACASVSPHLYEMVDDVAQGRRPQSRPDTAADPSAEHRAMTVCPGHQVVQTATHGDSSHDARLWAGWGPVLEVWEGHAVDEEIRYKGSSGGAVTALALACVESPQMHGALHIKARDDAPLLNETVLSSTRDQLVLATGSRYAPASPCERLDLIEQAPAPCVFIGKPCDVAAARRAADLNPNLDRNLAATIAIFCAGTPTTRATLALLDALGVNDPNDVLSLRYRGNGWPGDAVATIRTVSGFEQRRLSYEQAWGDILTNDKQWRCHVCADHTGELADISVGDPWYRTPVAGEKGQSLIVVRTRRGRMIMQQAIEQGYLCARRVAAARLPQSQPNLLKGRGAVWGRMMTCRLLGIPAPRYVGFEMMRFWFSALNWSQRFRSIAGTVKRIVRRGLRSRQPVDGAAARRLVAERVPKSSHHLRTQNSYRRAA